MNHCGIHRNSSFASSREEMRSSVSVENGEPMICPKPRRLSVFTNAVNDSVRPLRWQMCYQSEGFESKATPELLDIIFSKGGAVAGGGGYGGGYGGSDTQIASSPPFFSGSPPSRVSNPLIQDARFRDEKTTAPASSPASPSSSARKGGCLRANFGNKPAVRVEGFDCLDRDNRRNCSIPTLA